MLNKYLNFNSKIISSDKILICNFHYSFNYNSVSNYLDFIIAHF